MTTSPAPSSRLTLATYLASDLLALLGNAVAAVVLPLLVLSRTGSPAAAGLVLLAGTVPAALAGLAGGALVDRHDRRRISIAADVVSAASIAALPVVDAVWGLDVAWFVALAIVGAFGDLPGMTAREALAPAVAARCGTTVERLTALREGLGALVMIAGPALAGALVWLLPEAGALWVTAAASAGAATLTACLPPALGAYARDGDAAPGLAAAIRHSLGGFGILAGDGVLRGLVGLTVVAVAAIGTLQALLLPAHFVARGTPELLGTVLCALAAGLLTGAGGYAALAGRLPGHIWFRLGALAALAGLAGVAALPALAPLLAAAVLLGLGAAPMSAVAAGALVERIHEGRLGRAMGAQNTLALAALPLVAVPVALLAQEASPRVAGLVLVALVVVVGTACLTSGEMRRWRPAASVQGAMT